MRLTSHISRPIAYQECDRDGVLRHACYLRLMQEAAFHASAALGYDDTRYSAMHRIWLIRESTVDFFLPLHYRDDVEVTTWVADFRRVRSRRLYEIRRGADHALAARGATDWVFLDRDSGQPAMIPDEMIAAFQPAEGSAHGAARPRFPTLPSPPDDALTLSRQVLWRDVDSAGHMNNAAYGDLIEDAARQAQEPEPTTLWLQHLRIEYLHQAVFRDALRVTTWAEEAQTGMQRYTTVRRQTDGERLAQAVGLWVSSRIPFEN